MQITKWYHTQSDHFVIDTRQSIIIDFCLVRGVNCDTDHKFVGKTDIKEENEGKFDGKKV